MDDGKLGPKDLAERAARHLQDLIRLDTTNPPGRETLVADHVAAWARGLGLEPTVVSRVSGRDNVVVRVPGRGGAAPMMLASHADVVPAEPERWSHPPFSGDRADGCIWGRGALDIKVATALHLTVVERLLEDGNPLSRDLLVVVVADEEAGMENGSRFLVDEHPDLVRAEYALGEFGGFTATVMGLEVLLVQVAEKGLCWLEATATGTPGHGSVPKPDNAVVTLAAAIARIGQRRLPVHLCGAVREHLARLAAALPEPKRSVVGLLAREAAAGPLLDLAIRDPALRAPMVAMLTNTATPTTLRAGDRVNVVPGRASAELDGRTVPGQGPSDLVEELRRLAPELSFRVTRAEPSAEAPATTPVFRSIERVVRDLAPELVVLPFLLPGYTDAKSWSRLGTTCYGFVPLRLPRDFPPFFDLVHGHDERVPVDSLAFGVEALHRVVVESCR